LNVEFRESFLKDLQVIKERKLLDRVRNVINALESAEDLLELPNLKKLRGGKEYFRIRIGDYRLGIARNGDTVILVRFLNRKEIYRNFP
jgi:mRNA interferase RelE/StbE